jgi:hypothetical protein
MFFNLSACPSGWHALTAAVGRTLVGVGPSGTLAATVGSAFADQEARAHSHVVNDHLHTGQTALATQITDCGFWGTNGLLNATPASEGCLGVDTNCCGAIRGASHVHSFTTSTATGLTTQSTVDVVPYLQLLACQKD